MIAHDDDLRERLRRNLATHSVQAVPPGEHKRAAVAIVVVASEHGSDTTDPYDVSPEEFSVVPGDVTGFDGKVQGVDYPAMRNELLARLRTSMTQNAALPGALRELGEAGDTPDIGGDLVFTFQHVGGGERFAQYRTAAHQLHAVFVCAALLQ